MRVIRVLGGVVSACIAFTINAGPASDVEPGPGTVTVVQGVLQNAAGTPPQDVAAELVEFICPPQNLLGSDLQDRCNEIATEILGSGDVSGAQAALQDLAPEENSAIQTTQVDTSEWQIDVLRGRLGALRAGAPTAMTLSIDGKPLFATLGMTPSSLRGGGASADVTGSGPLGVFLNGNFGIGDKDSTSRETGFDFDSAGVTGGADYRLSDQSLIGIAAGYTTQDADLDSDNGNLETDGIAVSAYGSYYPSAQSYVNAIVSYAWNDHDQERHIAYTISSFLGTTVVNQNALSDTESDEIAGSLEAGYDFYRGNWTLTPYARLDVAHTEIDGYTETLTTPAPGTVGSGMAVTIEDQEFTSVTTALGSRVGTSVSLGSFDLFPQAGAEYVHEFDNDNDDIVGRLVDDSSGSRFFLPTDDPDRNYGNVSAGLTADFRNGWFGHFVYQGLIGYSDLDLHAFEVGARLQF